VNLTPFFRQARIDDGKMYLTLFLEN